MITVELKNLKFTIGSLKINGDNDFSVELNDFSYEVESSKEEIEMAEVSNLVSKIVSELNGNDKFLEDVNKIMHKTHEIDYTTNEIYKRIVSNSTDIDYIRSSVDNLQINKWVGKDSNK